MGVLTGTGFQACGRPIFGVVLAGRPALAVGAVSAACCAAGPTAGRGTRPAAFRGGRPVHPRSEERRVGKECRSASAAFVLERKGGSLWSWSRVAVAERAS